MGRLSLIDSAFLLAESAGSPKHVAGLQLFRRPRGASPGYLHELVGQLLERPAGAPFDQLARYSLAGMPRWERASEFSPRDHVFRHTLGPGAGLHDLLGRVAALHAQILDRHRPLWECHVLDGLSGGRFAVYFKIHHACADGLTVARWLSRPLAETPGRTVARAYWEPAKARDGGPEGGLQNVAAALATELAAWPGAWSLGLKQALKAVGMGDKGAAAPFTAPRTPLNTRLSAPRKLCVVKFPLARLRRVASATGATLNDVLLATCDQALAEYLSRHHALPTDPLVAEVPMSVRPAGESGGGNRVTLLLVQLARQGVSPLERLEAIRQHADSAKREVRSVSPQSANAYLMALSGIVLLGETLGVGASLPPVGNVLISNVPGAPRRLYMADAALLEAYPLSTLMPSLALNITVHTYRGWMFVGMVSAAAALPDLDRLGRRMRQALSALEHAADGIRPVAGTARSVSPSFDSGRPRAAGPAA